MSKRKVDLDGVDGFLLRFRLVTPDDAEYIHALRIDPRYNQHLSQATGSASDQRHWIVRYKDRERAGSEYYFVIERRSDGTRCGVVRLYGVQGGEFTWGSWILDQNKPTKAAFESAFLVYDIAFDRIGLDFARFDVRLENTRVVEFHRRFGATETGSDSQNIYFTYTSSAFRAIASEHRRTLKANREQAT